MEVLALLRPGLTERQIAAELTYRMLLQGAEGNSFDPIVVSGERGSLPHGVPGDRCIGSGDFVTMDFGCILDGWCSDMTRTVAIGSVTDEMRLVYDTVLAAQRAGIAAAQAGVPGRVVDAAARRVIEDAGYGVFSVTASAQPGAGGAREPERRPHRGATAAVRRRYLSGTRHLSARPLRRTH